MEDFEGVPATVEEILEFRDIKGEKIENLLNNGVPAVITVSAVIPGCIKNSAAVHRIIEEGLKEIESYVVPENKELISLPGGAAYILTFSGDPISLKEKFIRTEENHPLGRLMDLDIITLSRSFSRRDLGYPKRKCIICGNDAHICSRALSHSREEVLKKINNIYVKYFNPGSGNIYIEAE